MLDNERKDEEIKGKNKAIAKLMLELKRKEEELKIQQSQCHLPHAQLCIAQKFPHQIFAGKDASFFVLLKNCYGHCINNCKDHLNITIINLNGKQEKGLSVEISELGSGYYKVSFVIKKFGDYIFSVLVGETDIHDFPQK